MCHVNTRSFSWHCPTSLDKSAPSAPFRRLLLSRSLRLRSCVTIRPLAFLACYTGFGKMACIVTQSNSQASANAGICVLPAPLWRHLRREPPTTPCEGVACKGRQSVSNVPPPNLRFSQSGPDSAAMPDDRSPLRCRIAALPDHIKTLSTSQASPCICRQPCTDNEWSVSFASWRLSGVVPPTMLARSESKRRRGVRAIRNGRKARLTASLL